MTVSTYVLMKVLESAPRRYDLGMRLLTLGALDRAYDRLAAHVAEGQRVLDLGCGTGALCARAARRGARVKGIDVNPQMLAVARQRLHSAGLDRVELQEMGIGELDSEPAASYDVVCSALCLSELGAAEQQYALREALRLLVPGGLLLIADEVLPPSVRQRLLHGVIRLPLSTVAYLVAGRISRPIRDLPLRVRRTGYDLQSVRQSRLGSFVELVAQKPGQT